MKNAPLLLAAIVLLASALSARDQRDATADVPPPHADAAQVPPGFRAEVLLQDLTYPTSVESDDQGNLYVAEAGYAYGDPNARPRILRITPQGDLTSFATEGLVGPVNDLLWHRGRLYVSHRGRISVVENGGRIRDLIMDLPSGGDHQNNQMTIGPDGKLYFGQGTVTNAGVVGPDNAQMGWLEKQPNLHDVPARTLQLRPRVFTSKNPLQPGAQEARTMAFHPFNSGAERNPVIKGRIKANGAILRMDLEGQNLDVFASGLRNPFGLSWTRAGKLFATENGFDARGSRPIANDLEDLYEIKALAWYGWPDFAGGVPVTDPRFAPDDGPKPQFLLTEHPPVEKPLLTFPQHSAVTKLAPSPGGRFGPEGQLFIAFFGQLTPMTGETDEHGGHRVARVDPVAKTVETFFAARHHGATAQHGPSGAAHQPTGRTSPSRLDHDAARSARHPGAAAGPRRLMDVHFSGKDALYVADFGVVRMQEGKPVPVPGSGAIWRIVPEGTAAPQPPAGLSARNVRPAASSAERK